MGGVIFQGLLFSINLGMCLYKTNPFTIACTVFVGAMLMAAIIRWVGDEF